MISILIDGEELELKDPQITLNLKSPIFNETGSYSYPFKIPNTIRNRRILKFRHRIQSSNNKYEQFPCIVTYKGIQIINGLLNVLIGTADTFEGNIYADSGDFNYYLKDKILQQYPFGEKVFNERGDALGFFNTCRDKFYPEAPFCFPEIFNDKYFETDPTPDELLYYNRYFVNDVYGYELTLSQGSVAHTLLVPFLFMKDVLKTLFTQMGYQLKNELFAHEDFNKLIIYNSVGCNQTMTAFTYDVTHLYYNVHLPFIKVKDFLKSIENNWNARFFPNMFSKEVRIISIDDIIKSKDFIDFSANIRSISTDLDEYNYGTGLSMEGDPDDDYWKEIFDQDDEDDLKVRDPVEKFADLPGYPVDCIDFLRYVKEKDLFYKLDVSNQWIAQEFNSILRLTRLINRANANMIQNGMSSLIPTLDLECICGNKMSKYREITPRVMFAKTINDGVSLGLKTVASSQTDNFSLFYSGTNGLYMKYWKTYLDWIQTTFRVSIQKQMDFMELKNLDFSRKYVVNGIAYLLSEIQVTMTNEGLKPAKIKAYVCS